MDLMNSRFRNFPFGSKRKSNSPNIVTTPSTQSSLLNGTVITPTGSTSSTTSLPMNHTQGGLGRPPSYTYNPNAPRATSPLPPGGQTAAAHHPPPINTGAYPPGHSQGHPALGNTPQPPQYGGYGQQNVIHGGPIAPIGRYGGQDRPVEVEGAGRSKAQLIVGIDFVS